MKTCRLCLYESDEEDILPVWSDNSESLAEKIKKCVSIDVSSRVF